MAQSRYGSAGEMLAWLPIVTGHEGLGRCVPWDDNTGPLQAGPLSRDKTDAVKAGNQRGLDGIRFIPARRSVLY
jgi:hypothetical protein